jgi:hypothetical protein
MLQDADALIQKAGNKYLHGNSIGMESSEHIGYPRWWIYPYISRYYISDENPSEIKAIGMIFIDPDQSPTHPIILIGCFQSLGDPAVDNKYSYRYLSDSWFKLIAERELGVEYQVEGLNNAKCGVVKGFDINEIPDLETLNEKIVKPLLAMNCQDVQ